MDAADLSLFAHVVGRPDSHVDLAQAALMIAEGEYPNLDIPAYMSALDRFAARARRALAAAPEEAPLAVVLIEVCRRVGVEARGVSYPGHFLVRSPAPNGGAVFIDPFEGVRLDEDDLQAIYHRATGEDGPVDPRRLEPATRKQILLRMLNNLRCVYETRADHQRLQDVLLRMAVLASPDEQPRE